MANSSKPLPLMADGKPYYTLSSYDPVSVEVLVPLVTDDDIDAAIGDSILLCKDILEKKTQVLGMKGE